MFVTLSRLADLTEGAEVSGKVDTYITDWSALSPFGLGKDAFIQGFAAGRSNLRVVEAFDPVAVLGPRAAKGIRSLDRMTLMSMVTSGMLLAEHPALHARQSSIGLVLGTSTGSLASIADFTRDTFVQDKPYLVNPAAFPNTVMNGVAGHTAIWHGLRGLNSTISAGHLTAIAALRYATRMIRRGYADVLIVGAIEELSAPVVHAVRRLEADGSAAGAPSSEGCLMFLLECRTESSGRGGAAAEVTDFVFRVSQPGDPAEVRAAQLSMAITTLLSRNGVAPDQVHWISLSQAGDPVGDAAERAAVDQVFPDPDSPRRIVISEQAGSSFSALGAFQLAAVLAAAGDQQGGGGRPAVITSVGVDGAMACALIRC